MSEEISSEISSMSPPAVAAGTGGPPGPCAGEPHAATAANKSKRKGAKRTE